MGKGSTWLWILGGLGVVIALRKYSAPDVATVTPDISSLSDPVMNVESALRIARLSSATDHKVITVDFNVHVNGFEKLGKSAAGLANDARGYVTSILQSLTTHYPTMVPDTRFTVNVVNIDGGYHVNVGITIGYAGTFPSDFASYVSSLIAAIPGMVNRLVGTISVMGA